MKKLFFSFVVFALLGGTSAFAAELSLIKSPPVWTGLYAGIEVGGTWANRKNVNLYTWPTKPLSGYFVTAVPLNGGIS